jgi:predicted kinase
MLGLDKMQEKFIKFIQDHLKSDNVMITCGFPGTYKTETSEEISKLIGYQILRTDLIRLEVLKNEDIFDEKVAANMDKRKQVYDEMFRQAGELVKSGSGLILDATFIIKELRHRAASVAAENNRTFVILQTSCPQKVSINRILKRSKDKYESNALTEQAYLNNKKKFEPIDLDGFKIAYPKLRILHFVVDTTEDQPDNWNVIEMNVIDA